MVKKIDPLGQKPLVEKDGRASLFFAGQWDNLRKYFDSFSGDQVTSIASLVAQVSNNVTAIATNVANIATNAAAIAALTARQIIAGTGLSGGGTLASNVTLNLANTAVTPGSYTNTDLTVDAQGRITAAANGTGGGGAYARVGQSSGQALAGSATTTLQFPATVEDTLGLWDGSNHYFDIPSALDGQVIMLQAQMQHTADSASVLEMYIEESQDGGSNWERVAQSPNGGLDHFGIAAATAVLRTATGYLYRVRVFSGTAKTTADARTHFTLAQL